MEIAGGRSMDYDEKRIARPPNDTPILACSFTGDVEPMPRIIPNDAASKPRCSRLICGLNGCFAARTQARCTKCRLESAVSHNTMNCDIHLTSATATKQNSLVPLCIVALYRSLLMLRSTSAQLPLVNNNNTSNPFPRNT